MVSKTMIHMPHERAWSIVKGLLAVDRFLCFSNQSILSTDVGPRVFSIAAGGDLPDRLDKDEIQK